MEKILRKVSTKDRLPEPLEEVFCDCGEYGLNVLYLNKDHAIKKFDKWTISNSGYNALFEPEYWYEEVDLIELLPKQAISHLALYDEAKERYEKAMSVLKNGNYIRTSMVHIEKALKIAAGIKEE
jgi:hypothetical protein